MTREEKIAELINIRDNFNYTLAPREVFDDAIKALENQKYEDDIKVKTPETPGSMLTLEEAIRYTNWQMEDNRELARKSFNANEREKSWKYSSRADYNHQLNLWLRELKMLKEMATNDSKRLD